MTCVHADGSFDAETTKCLGGSIGHEFLHLNPKHFKLIQPETIVITNYGRVTMAMLKQENEVLKIGVAKCSPDDEFSLETGAKLALGRLFEQEPKKEEPKYKAGDRVRIVKEKTGENWNPEGAMDKWLGQTMTIKSVRESGMRCYKMKEDDELWCWYPWMIEGLAKPLVIKRENKALEDDNYQKCEIIAELKGRIKKLDRENLGLRQQVANMRRKEEARYKSDAWVD